MNETHRKALEAAVSHGFKKVILLPWAMRSLVNVNSVSKFKNV